MHGRSYLFAILLVGCGESYPPDTALSLDAATPADARSTSQDVGRDDATEPERDAGEADAGEADAGEADAGAPPDVDAAPTGPAFYRNAVLDFSGDTFCAYFGGRYIVYLPDQVRRDGRRVGGRVVAFSSSNLVDWHREGVVFDNIDDAYGGEQTVGLWAPEVQRVGDRYFLYYVNVMTGGADAEIGNKDIAVVGSANPLDFRGGRSTILLDGDYAFIDPSPFVDPSDDQAYLLYKFRGEFGTGSLVRIRPMSGPRAFNGESTRLVHSDDVPNSFNIVEHPMMIRRGGMYVFLFSADNRADSTYRIAYMTGDRPTGPFTRLTTLFRSDADQSGDPSRSVIAPGAPSIVRDGAGADWMVYRQKSTLTDTFAERQVCIDAIDIQPARRRIVGEATKGRRLPAPTPR